MTQLSQKRFYRRILAVCPVFDLKHNFLGLTLDLSIKGIHIIVHNSFPDKSQFSFLLHQSLDEDEDNPYITLKVEKVWRKSTNEEYDEIGAKIIAVDLEVELQKLIKYCDNKVLKKYQI